MGRWKRSEKEEFWRMIIADQQASGLSVRALCKRDGISESMFYNWRSKLAARDGNPPPDTSPKLIPVAVSSKARSPIVAIVHELENASRQFEIQTPGGFKLRVSDSIASSSLGRLLSVVAHRGDKVFEQAASDEPESSDELDYLLPDKWLATNPAQVWAIDNIRRGERKPRSV